MVVDQRRELPFSGSSNRPNSTLPLSCISLPCKRRNKIFIKGGGRLKKTKNKTHRWKEKKNINQTKFEPVSPWTRKRMLANWATRQVPTKRNCRSEVQKWWRRIACVAALPSLRKKVPIATLLFISGNMNILPHIAPDDTQPDPWKFLMQVFPTTLYVRSKLPHQKPVWWGVGDRLTVS